MADNNDKLSLHIGSKNVTTLTSGFVDVPAIPTISTKLTLNRQTVVGVGGGTGGPAEVTTVPTTRWYTGKGYSVGCGPSGLCGGGGGGGSELFTCKTSWCVSVSINC